MVFVERIRKVQKKIGAVLKKAQNKMKKQANNRWKEIEVWRKKKVMLSIKDLVFKKRLVKINKTICQIIYHWRSGICKYN